MPISIHDQIAANKRLSFFYASLIVVLLAAFGGAITGYYAPEFWIAGTAGSAVIGVVVGIVGWTRGSKIVLQLSQARYATPKEIMLVNNVAEEMAIAAGIPVPEVYVIDSSVPNAFATGRSPEEGIVCVTTGLLEILDRDELQGVVAHEIGHIRNNDIKFMTTLAIVVGIIPLLSHFFFRSLWYGGGRSRNRDGGGQAQLIFLVIAVVLAILAPIMAKMLELAVSRKREYMADASAAQFTRNPDALASALEKLSQPRGKLEAASKATEHMYIVNPFKPLQKANSLFSTHPPTMKRVAALRGLSGMDYRKYLSMEANDTLPD